MLLRATPPKVTISPILSILEEFTAEFTAYCPRKEEGGDTDCRKKKLDPSKKTCAAPMVGKY
ncbi:hypothetical protein, partial [Clostridioides difficile]|uniref:hypothetical protein n=1 Tax=Clostridioides difficile TaxID=1496 RepID=UPI00115E4476